MDKEAVQLMSKSRKAGLVGLSAKLIASSGNRTRAARVAGEHSTTEPTMLFSDEPSQRKGVSTLQNKTEKHSRSVGFEPTPAERN